MVFSILRFDEKCLIGAQGPYIMHAVVYLLATRRLCFGSVGLFVFVFALLLVTLLKRIVMKWGGKRNKWLNYGGGPDHHADCPIGNPAIM